MADQAAADIKNKASDVKDAAADAKDKAAAHARAAGNDLSDDLAMLRLQVEELTTSLAEVARDKAEAGARQVAAVARDGYEKAADTAGSAYAEMERYAANRPAEALGVAAGIGLLLGFLLARR